MFRTFFCLISTEVLSRVCVGWGTKLCFTVFMLLTSRRPARQSQCPKGSWRFIRHKHVRDVLWPWATMWSVGKLQGIYGARGRERWANIWGFLLQYSGAQCWPLLVSTETDDWRQHCLFFHLHESAVLKSLNTLLRLGCIGDTAALWFNWILSLVALSVLICSMRES